MQVFLDVFTYFMFWTAFYVLRGSRSGTPKLVSTAFIPKSSTVLLYYIGIICMGRAVRSVAQVEGVVADVVWRVWSGYWHALGAVLLYYTAVLLLAQQSVRF